MLAIELVIFAVVRSLSVDLTASYLRMAIGGIVFGAPVLFVIVGGLRHRFRFGMRGVLILVTITAAVFAAAMRPLATFRSDRSTAKRFHDARMSPRYGLRLDGQRQQLWFWLRDFAADLESIGPTRRIIELTIHDQNAMRLLLNHPDELTALEVLEIEMPRVLDASDVYDAQLMTDFHAWLSQRPPLKFLRFNGVIPNSSDKTPSTKVDVLDFWVFTKSKAPAPDDRFVGLPHFDIETLLISNLVPNEREFSSLERTSVSKICLDEASYQTDALEVFKKRLPNVAIEWH